MKTQELIKKYNETVEAEERTRVEEKARVIQEAQDLFLENCRVWLGDFWDEFQPGELRCLDVNNWACLELSLRLPISFMEVDGNLTASFYHDQRGSRWNSGKMDFGWLDMGEHNTIGWLDLPMDHDNKAKPVQIRDLAALLSRIEKYVPIRAENKRQRLERDRAEALEFSSGHAPWVQKQIELRVAEFPDLADQIQEAGRAAIEEQEKWERERQEENQRYQDEAQERTRLQELALQAWQEPFTVYKIKYGAKLDDGGEGESYCEEIYTVSDTPGDDGYYLAFHGGNLTRRVRPVHVLSFERLQITDCENAPYELKRYMDLASKKFPGVTSYAALPPAEFFNVDDLEKSGGG